MLPDYLPKPLRINLSTGEEVPPPKWSDLYELVKDKGLSYYQLNTLRQMTSRDRHWWRVREAWRAAERAVRSQYTDLAEDRVERLTRTLLVIEYNGTGGPLNGGLLCGDKSTARSPWAQSLGKGRAHASDGPAWDAAIRVAAGDFSPEREDVIAVMWIAPEAAWSYCRGRAYTSVNGYDGVTDQTFTESAMWLRAVQKIRASSGNSEIVFFGDCHGAIRQVFASSDLSPNELNWVSSKVIRLAEMAIVYPSIEVNERRWAVQVL